MQGLQLQNSFVAVPPGGRGGEEVGGDDRKPLPPTATLSIAMLVSLRGQRAAHINGAQDTGPAATATDDDDDDDGNDDDRLPRTKSRISRSRY